MIFGPLLDVIAVSRGLVRADDLEHQLGDAVGDLGDRAVGRRGRRRCRRSGRSRRRPGSRPRRRPSGRPRDGPACRRPRRSRQGSVASMCPSPLGAKTTSLPSSRSYFQGSSKSASANSSAETSRPSSSRPSWRIGRSGRHRSGLLGIADRSGQASALLVLGDVGLADLGDQPLDEALGRLALGLGLEVGADPVAEDRDGDLADVVERDAEPAVHRGHRLAAEDQVLAGPGAGAVVDQVLDELRASSRRPGRVARTSRVTYSTA